MSAVERGNLVRAARRLGLPSRYALYRLVIEGPAEELARYRLTFGAVAGLRVVGALSSCSTRASPVEEAHDPPTSQERS